MNTEIPEEVRTIAALIGESSQIDAMMTNKSPNLVTDTNTLKQGLTQYIQQSRNKQQAQPSPPPSAPPIPVDTPEHPLVTDSLPTPQAPLTPQEPTNDEDQMLLNFDPSKADIVIDLLKDISLKLQKQNTVLQNMYEQFESEEKGVPVASIKSGESE